MLVKGHGWCHLCGLPGVIGNSVESKVHTSTPASINIEQGGFELSVYYPDYCNLH